MYYIFIFYYLLQLMINMLCLLPKNVCNALQ